MLIDGPKITEGSSILNATVASGDKFPDDPSPGELFFRTDLNAFYFFSNLDWIDFKAVAWDVISNKPNTLSGYGITDGQKLDIDLTALAELTSTGLLARTGDGIVATRAIINAGGISISNANGVLGNPTIGLVNTGVTPGTFGSSTQTGAFTVDAFGRVMSASNILITPTFASITNKPTTLSGYGITDDLKLGDNTGANLGTAAVGVATTAARADHVHNMPNFDELKNVAINSKAINDSLVWNGSSWTNRPFNLSTSATADKWTTSRLLTMSQDALGTVSIDGSKDINISVTLANSGVSAGTYGAADKIPSLVVDSKGRITAISLKDVAPPAFADITNKPTNLAGYGIRDAVNTSLLGANNGVATLDGNGKLNTNQIPSSLVGALQYQGLWDANTNTPTLTSGTGTKGQFYKVSTKGTTTLDGQSYWQIGDMVIFDGSTWDRLEGGPTEVTSVAGRVGDITLTNVDVNLGNVENKSSNTIRSEITKTNVVNGLGYTPVEQGTGANQGTNAVKIGWSTGAEGLLVSVDNTALGYIYTSNVGRRVAFSEITNKPTTIAGYGITDAVSSAIIGAPSGLATLGSDSKLTASQVPNVLTSYLDFKKGADIASAKNMNLQAATGNYVTITGDMGITTLDLNEGALRIVKFTGSPTIVHGTNLLLPNAKNINVIPNDIGVFVGDGKGTTILVSYSRAIVIPTMPSETVANISATTTDTTINIIQGGDVSYFRVSLQSNTKITFANLPASTDKVYSWTTKITNDGTAGRALSWDSIIKWAGGQPPNRTTAANAVDIWTFVLDNGIIYGSLSVLDAR
jgi:hypothetical protein